jgi:hypothetical protein
MKSNFKAIVCGKVINIVIKSRQMKAGKRVLSSIRINVGGHIKPTLLNIHQKYENQLKK